MPKISLTRLVDFVSKSGGPKQTSAAQTKRQLAEGYDPATDFYRIIREAIVESHRDRLGKSHITDASLSVHDRTRRGVYPDLAKAYNAWWGRKNLCWFAPPAAEWDTGRRFTVSINPELGLIVADEPHVIKLYFKSEKLTKQRVEIVTHLMQRELEGEVNAGTRFSVLDIRNKKLHTIDPPSFWGPMLDAEIAHLAALWPHL